MSAPITTFFSFRLISYSTFARSRADANLAVFLFKRRPTDDFGVSQPLKEAGAVEPPDAEGPGFPNTGALDYSATKARPCR